MDSERLQRQIDVLLDEAEAAIKGLDWRVVHDRAQAVRKEALWAWILPTGPILPME